MGLECQFWRMWNAKSGDDDVVEVEVVVVVVVVVAVVVKVQNFQHGSGITCAVNCNCRNPRNVVCFRYKIANILPTDDNAY